VRPSTIDDPWPRRVAHVLAQFRPHSNGYVIRSEAILREQQNAGCSPCVITSPFYPGQASAESGNEGMDAVPIIPVPHPTDARGALAPADLFCRTLYRGRRALQRRGRAISSSSSPAVSSPAPQRSGLRKLVDNSGAGGLLFLEERLLMRRFAREIGTAVSRHGSDVIHAHSPYRDGLPAQRAGRRLRLPVVYEMRGLWEDSAVATGTMEEGDRAYRRWRRQETESLLGADAVVCLGRQLRDEIIERGVSPDRVFIVPNAVDPESLNPPGAPEGPCSRIEAIRSRLTPFTVGYAGSIRALEGLDLMLQGLARLVAAGEDLGALIVGEGTAVPALRQLARQLEIDHRVVFAGSFPHVAMHQLYDLMDIVVLPRPDLRVTRMVPPLKPLEAMAMGKPLLATDLPAIRELVEDSQTGILHRPGDVEHWVERCRWLLCNPEARRQMSERARRHVRQECTWRRALAILPEVYECAARRAETRSLVAGSEED